MDDDPRQLLLAAARASALRRGAPADVVALEGTSLVAGVGASRRAVPVSELLSAWNLLPPEDRARRLDAALDRLLDGPPVVRVPKERLVLAWGAAALAWLCAFGAVSWAGAEASRAAERKRAREAPPPVASESAASAASRKQAVCSGVRKRVASGAPFGPYEAEGWIVELWLGREDGALRPSDPSLQGLDAERVATLGGPAVPGAEVEVIAPGPPPGGGETAAPGGALVQLRGGFATAYVDVSARPRFLALAEALAERSQADLGALWARCGELPWHDLGAWFQGRDPGAAVGVMLFQIGRHGDAGAVPASAAGGSANTLLGLVGRARRGLPAELVRSGVGDLGGKVDERGGKTTISFPLGGYTLATRTSRELYATVEQRAP